MKSRFEKFVMRWTGREPLVVVSVATIVSILSVLFISLVTLRDNYSLFGPALGADYPQFYAAGQMIRDGHAAQLYDLHLQQDYYRAILPKEGEESYLPYVYPPFFAIPFVVLSLLQYHYSFLIWGVILIVLGAAGIAMNCAAATSLEPGTKCLLMLAGLAFPPFLMESVLSGQPPPFGLFALSLAIFFLSQNRPVRAGIALALCLYKPTTLVLLLPMQVVGRQWKVLFGFLIGSVLLTILSISVVGVESFIEYVRFLLGYASLTKEGFRNHKYVDVASFLRLLTDSTSQLPRDVGMCGILCAVVALSSKWYAMPERNERYTRMLWCNTIAWTLIMNVYVGIYDVALLLIPLINLVDEASQLRTSTSTTSADDGLPYHLRIQFLFLFIACWISQFMALVLRIQPLTIVLGWIAFSQFQDLKRTERDSIGTAS